MDAQAKMENILIVIFASKMIVGIKVVGGKAVCVCRDFKTGNIKIEYIILIEFKSKNNAFFYFCVPIGSSPFTNFDQD